MTAVAPATQIRKYSTIPLISSPLTLKQSVVRFPEALSLKLRISAGVINSKKSFAVSPLADQKRSQYASLCPATSCMGHNDMVNLS